MSYDQWKLRSDRDEYPDMEGDRPEPDEQDEPMTDLKSAVERLVLARAAIYLAAKSH